MSWVPSMIHQAIWDCQEKEKKKRKGKHGSNPHGVYSLVGEIVTHQITIQIAT